jgi:hypothetical protein
MFAPNRKKAWIMLIIYATFEAFCWIFPAVYYANAHGLTASPWLSFLFIIPLPAIALFVVLLIANKTIGSVATSLLNIGMAWIWVYMACQGIYALATKSNSWTWVMLMFGVIFLFGFLVATVVHATLALRESSPKAQ